MTRNNAIVSIILIIIFGFSLWALLPMQGERFGRKGLHLGLDLVGGVHLVYQADFSGNETSEQTKSDMSRAVLTIQRRIDKYGVTEPVIQQLGADRIMVQLPGFTDIEAAKGLVEQTGFLEFREVELNASAQPVYLRDYLNQARLQLVDKKETGDRIFVSSVTNSLGKTDYKTIAFLSQASGALVFTDVSGNPVDNSTLQNNSDSLAWIPARGDSGKQLTGNFLADASPGLSGDLTPKPEVNIKWNGEGGVMFDQIAKRLYNPNGQYAPQYFLGIFLDNTLLSAPRINSPQFNGSGVITGSYTVTEADDLANLLKSGSLPMPLKKPPMYQEKVSATLGANFIAKSWLAGLIGIILIMLFMIAYYRLPGFLSSLALIFYGVLVLAIFKLWPVTLTLAGLGGFVVSIGMAVDANILIFERMKEELRAGRTLGAAIEAGFDRAWSAIRDSNITTFIACIILAIVGSNMVAGTPIKWFGITLFIGVAVSMVTAILVTRTLLRLLIHSPLANKSWLFTAGGGKK